MFTDYLGWKEHFERIQADPGVVNPRIWQTFPPDAPTQAWLGEPPNDEELDAALAAMKTGKAPGADAIMMEHIRHGGPALRQEVYEVVRAAWTAAIQADDGGEATDWAAEWRVGLMCPLWKKKGDRK